MKIRNLRLKKSLLGVLLGIVIVTTCCIFVIKLSTDHSDDDLQSRDIVQTDKQMTAARDILMPLLQPLSIQLGARQPSTCSEGDPSLYAHMCGSQTTAVYDVNTSSLVNANVLSEKLQKLDTSLKSSGWEYGSNDFRISNMQPVDTWASTIQAYGARVAYANKNCSFEIVIWSSETSEKNRSAYPGRLSCYIASGPPRSP